MLVVTHPHPRKALAGIDWVDDVGVETGIEETVNRGPHDIFHLDVRYGVSFGAHQIDIAPHNDSRSMSTVPALLVVQPAQVPRPGEIDAYFL